MIVEPAATVPPMERYEVNPVTGCWLWLGYTDKNGYARLDGENAHRVFYREHFGAIAEGNDVDHLCKRRSCVNPAHLEAVPELENIRRKSRTVVYRGRPVDICRKGHVLEGNNLRVRRGKRVCETCRVSAYVANARARAEAEGREYKPYKHKGVAA